MTSMPSQPAKTIATTDAAKPSQLTNSIQRKKTHNDMGQRGLGFLQSDQTDVEDALGVLQLVHHLLGHVAGYAEDHQRLLH